MFWLVSCIYQIEIMSHILFLYCLFHTHSGAIYKHHNYNRRVNSVFKGIEAKSEIVSFFTLNFR